MDTCRRLTKYWSTSAIEIASTRLIPWPPHSLLHIGSGRRGSGKDLPPYRASATMVAFIRPENCGRRLLPTIGSCLPLHLKRSPSTAKSFAGARLQKSRPAGLPQIKV